MEIKFKETPREYHICLGCHGIIENKNDECFDGEDYWHEKCKEEFDRKMFGLINKPPRTYLLRRLECERE